MAREMYIGTTVPVEYKKWLIFPKEGIMKRFPDLGIYR